MQKYFFILISLLGLAACSSYDYPPQLKIDESLVRFSGESLAGELVTLPDDLEGKPALLLFGFVHKSQFDIDRWLIGLDMTSTEIDIYEIPAIKNPFARLVSNNIDDSMREGIPRELWSIVITVYKDGDMVQKFTGNRAPKNARVVLIDGEGRVKHFYNRGFSVDALNALRNSITKIKS